MSRTHRRPAARGGAIMTGPWRRAPILLLRQPVVFLAIVGATAILAVAAASGPLFLSTIGTASLHAQAEQTCPERSLPTVNADVSGDQLAASAAAGLQAFAQNGLPNAYYSADGYSHIGASLVHLYSRRGALDHVAKLTPTNGADGVWLPDVFARKIGAGPGDTIKTVSGARLHVTGIYRDLAPDPFALSNLARYWCTYTDQIVSTVASDGSIAATAPQFRQGPWIIADEATVARASEDTVAMSWTSPMSTITNPLSSFDSAVNRARAAADNMGGSVLATPDDGLAEITVAAHSARKGVTGSIVPIEVAGVIVAGLLVGGAGMFWTSARQREIRLLVARGVGPIPLAGKAILETIGPAVIGAALGFVATSYLVRAVGPARALEADAPLRALELVAVAVGLGVLAIGVIGGLAGRDRTTGRPVSWIRQVPWEVALLAFAIGLDLMNLHRSAVSIDHTIVQISPLVVLYPLLGATAALILVGRLVGTMLPGLGRSATSRRIAPYLALRRISRSRAVVVGLFVGTALPCCLLMYASTVTDTVSHEVTQKYQTNLGAPHVLQIYGVDGALFDPHGDGSQVVIYKDQVLFGDDIPAYVLGIDPATFDNFAYTSAAQRGAVARLATDSGSGRPSAIVVNPDAGADTSRVHIGRSVLAVKRIATMKVFPGLRNSASPMLVVDQRALANLDNGVERINQFWTDDAHYAPARKMLLADHFSILFQLTSDVVIGTTGLLPVTWLFGYLRALAVLIGVVAIAGLVFGVAARTRRRRVAYVLSRRMGMSKLAHLNSLLLELTLVVGTGWVAGSGLGVGSFGFVYRAFDVYPELAPPPAFTAAWWPVVVTAVISAAIVVLTSLSMHLLAERTRPAEILRLE